MKKYILLVSVLLLSFVLATTLQSKPRNSHHNIESHAESEQPFYENKQPFYIFFDGRLYFVRTPLFEKDVGDPSTWNEAGKIVSSCGYESVPTQNGEINFDIGRLVEPIIYMSSDNILFIHLFENNVSPFRGLELVEQK